jgi:Fic family protein
MKRLRLIFQSNTNKIEDISLTLSQQLSAVISSDGEASLGSERKVLRDLKNTLQILGKKYE